MVVVSTVHMSETEIENMWEWIWYKWKSWPFIKLLTSGRKIDSVITSVFYVELCNKDVLNYVECLFTGYFYLSLNLSLPFTPASFFSPSTHMRVIFFFFLQQ